ncbi:hypothetical protein D9623_06390 [Azospirillum brasilense]|uniref:Uncharacterized protein n=1 Tax=Azospirillum brasilense TaxID=192 RepID=A0A0P0E9B3_AZOBR|nr:MULTISPECIES: hypothetical protein [Azospirillum]ALJ34887.1 hypothetical protein AMK58_05335 [Azospirillum brasilense]MDW7557401.1 hypothetical protein [Azospirillum brasilense]MDW7596839.1 hypothetical protein [Azospirillum brasilense]MDW7631896.1 hypothetical protein [Azospirillum brasilense]MDX5953561.1 hypothetical protein [Azospirillum brasilense]
MSTLCVTGANARYFITTLAFLEGLTGRFPLERVRVCDFGLTDGQRDYLRAAGLLLDRPKILPADAHPYLCKGHLSEYCSGEAWDSLLWLDADMMVGALDLTMAERLAEELRVGGKALALTGTVDRMTVGGMMEELRNGGHYVSPAERLLGGRGVDLGMPYLSSGLMLWVSRGLLAQWAMTCRGVEQHALWEQNVLNALVLPDPACVEVLDARLWQVYDAPLADVTMPDPRDRHDFVLDGRSVMAVHASSRKGHHLDADLALNFGEHVLKGYLRTFANPALQQQHLRHLAAAVTRNRAALAEIGVLQPR